MNPCVLSTQSRIRVRLLQIRVIPQVLYFAGSYCFDTPEFANVVKIHLFLPLPDLESNVGQLD